MEQAIHQGKRLWTPSIRRVFGILFCLLLCELLGPAALAIPFEPLKSESEEKDEKWPSEEKPIVARGRLGIDRRTTVSLMLIAAVVSSHHDRALLHSCFKSVPCHTARPIGAGVFLLC